MNLEEHLWLSQEDGIIPVHRGSAVKGWSAKLKDEQKNSKRKDIGLDTLVCCSRCSSLDLWSDVRLSSVLGGDVFMNFLCEAEVT